MRTALASIAVFAVALLPGCAREDPCLQLPPPSTQEISASQSGAEVEREVEDRFGNEIECELVNGAWLEEREQ